MDLDVHAPAIASGDAHAYAAFLRGAERPLRLSLTPFARSVDVEAVLQEALLRLWQVTPRFVPDGKENGLLRLGSRIARNLALDALRRCHEQLSDEPPELAVQPHETDPLLRRTIQGCRDQLPEKPRLALGARLDSDGAEPDVLLAARLTMQPNTFLQNVTRAKKLLADCLRKAGVELEGIV